ncbi:MAG: hypothetical protein KBT31_02990, partial [Firmicutes bacterium]|nr:hypothetical protein [Candidatus Colimorpha enterica]
FENVKEGAKEILSMSADSYESEEAYEAAIADKLEETLSGAGIDISKFTEGDNAEVLNDMARAIATNPDIEEIKANLPADPSEISDDDVAALLLTYFETFGQPTSDPE